MKTRTNTIPVLASAALASLILAGCSTTPNTPEGRMTFFVTSTGSGKGADLGGLAGADQHCANLAKAVGGGNRAWRAYLSAAPAGGAAAVHARDRIGKGPWQNVKGVVVANSVEQLHSDANNLNKQTSVTEKGEIVKGRGDTPNQHDVLTGSTADGRLATTAADTTCSNWTSGDKGSAIVGHHDRIGLNDSAPMKSWNSSHGTKGCSQPALVSTGGAGLYYCFAAD